MSSRSSFFVLINQGLSTRKALWYSRKT